VYYPDIIVLEPQPEYQLFPDKHQTSLSNISGLSPMQAFLKRDSEDPFRQKVIELVAKNAILARDNLTFPKIAWPNIVAIQVKTVRYRKKYGIDIRTVNLDNLHTNLQYWQKKITQPTYMGIIVGDFTKDYAGHVSSVLCYFSGKDDTKNEYVILDCSGDSSGLKSYLEQCGVPHNNIYDSCCKTQVDRGSCNEGAVSILRNALLSLKYNQHTDGFGKALGKGKIDQDQHIIALPPEWDYTEQISNKLPNAGKALVIRDFFSKQKGKSVKTVEQHRTKYTKTAELSYTVLCPNFTESQAFKELIIPKEVVSLQLSRDFKMVFVVEKKINTYLRDKAMSEKDKWTKLT